MSTLAEQQQALLEALFASPSQTALQGLQSHARGVGVNPQRGFLVYQSNGHMLAEKALGAVYPVVAQMVGEDSFADLARALWHTHPPQRGDIAEWGGALAEFMQHSAQLEDVPYLPDVAKAEWALHRCALAPDREPALATLELLTHEDPQTLTLDWAPGLVALSSAWPLASLVLAHLLAKPTLSELAQELQAHIAQDVVVWRVGFEPRLRLAHPGEVAFLHGLQSGLALEPALDAAPALDFSRWLTQAVQTGLVLGVRRISFQLPEVSS